MRKRLSGWRAAAAAALLLTACSAVLLATLLWRAEAALRSESLAKLAAVGRSVADPVGRAVEYGIPLVDLPGMAKYLRSLAKPNPELVYLTVTDSGGTPLFRYGVSPDTFPAAPAVPSGETRAGLIDMALPILSDDKVVGAVHLGMADGVAAGALPAFLWQFALVMTMGLATSAGLAVLFTRQAVDRPLGALRHTLAACADDQPSPMPAIRAWGEMAELVVAVGNLQDRWAVRRRQFRQDMDELVLAQPDAATRNRLENLAIRAETGS